MQFFSRVLALAAATVPFFAQAIPLSERADSIVPGKWIVQLAPDADIATVEAHHIKVREIHARNIARRSVADEEKGGVEREYGFGKFKGYAGAFDAATIDELRKLPEVVNVEEDYIMKTSALVTQDNAPWGLGSISSRTRGATDYVYDESAGEGQFAYIVDTGIRITHEDFEGRAVWGYNAVNWDNNDNAGHGTHVAGTVASKTYGVAKKATVVAVKIFEGDSGQASTVIGGFNWAVNDIVEQGRQDKAVINMSLGGRASSTWDSVITAAFDAGVLSVVAAGNENQPASNVSPARSPEVICVGNVQSNDARYSGRGGSNYGPSVSLFAPGTGIVSTWPTSDTGTESLSGTSMASPHVAGLVAYLRALEGLTDPTSVKARILELATPGRVTDTRDSPNLLAYNGNGR